MGFNEGSMGEVPGSGEQIKRETLPLLIAEQDNLVLEKFKVYGQIQNMLEEYRSEEEILADPDRSKLYGELNDRYYELIGQIQGIIRKIREAERKGKRKIEKAEKKRL